ncbi:unnamed protein product [Rhizophagus irregularis]|nr:unnamed protein product [Rhizophagus irregularis]
MVSFSCDSCADIVRKPKTQQHLSRCPNAQFTCIDCNTTFHGNNFIRHTSCISEAEKYQKSLYKVHKKGKQDTPNKQKRQKVDMPSNINNQSLEGEQSDTFNNSKILKSSEQDQIPDIVTGNNKNHNQESSFKKKKKNKNKKNQQQDDQPNGNKISIKEEMKIKIDIAAKVSNGYNNEAEILNTNIKQEDNTIVANSRKKKKKKSINNINGNDNNKVEESNKEGNNIDELQSVQTYVANETPKKEDNVVNLNNNSSKKKKKKKKNDTVNKDNNNLVNPNVINGVDQSLVGILKKKELSDEKSKKRKSVEFVLPESSTNNKKKKLNDKRSKFSHENDVANKLFNYCESVPAVVKKIFKNNSYEELNLKRLEEMVVRQLIPGSNSSESELKEKFLENIVLIMKDGKITLK